MKLMGLILALLLAAPTVAFQDGSAALLFHLEDAGVLRRRVFVAPGKLSTGFVQQRCSHLLESHRAVRVAIVELLEVLPDPRRIPNGSSHFADGEYLRLYDMLAKLNWRSARCLLTPQGGSYVMRLGETLERGLLYGTEPSVVEVDGVRAEVIHLSPGLPWDAEKIDLLEAFVLVNRMPSAASAAAIAEELRKLLGPTLRRVNLKDQALFPQHYDFPVYPLFTASLRPAPEKDVWRRLWTCGVEGQRFRCGKL